MLYVVTPFWHCNTLNWYGTTVVATYDAVQPRISNRRTTLTEEGNIPRVLNALYW